MSPKSSAVARERVVSCHRRVRSRCMPPVHLVGRPSPACSDHERESEVPAIATALPSASTIASNQTVSTRAVANLWSPFRRFLGCADHAVAGQNPPDRRTCGPGCLGGSAHLRGPPPALRRRSTAPRRPRSVRAHRAVTVLIGSRLRHAGIKLCRLIDDQQMLTFPLAGSPSRRYHRVTFGSWPT